jgi:16S rRNA (uracil1498-N3)-methyltransferase
MLFFSTMHGKQMPAERYFTPDPLNQDEIIELIGAEFHHLARVMRARKGDHVELVNGKGALAEATILEIRKEKGLLKISHVTQETNRPCQIILAQAIPKPNRLDFVLEKGTELGVDCFWLFPGTQSVKKEFFPHQIERAQQLTIAAMKQCGRLTLPSIEILPPLSQWPSLEGKSPFFGDLDPSAPLFETLWKSSSSPIYPALFITGPESGFNEKEIEILKKLGAKGVKLHPHILRTDTASLVALSLLSHWILTPH